ncbi:hypothetical protein [Emticicia sp. BO119]|uniref:hypothetical protein n=1 Tax=Emticicia sp. BO119 TaxID=2757768 RepID=UPI0015F0B8C9|nr:hypothetical protein [Emticicia sp. BO119]MBA4852263.1 hypothetical protein [Emticicia sp. BO119]
MAQKRQKYMKHVLKYFVNGEEIITTPKDWARANKHYFRSFGFKNNSDDIPTTNEIVRFLINNFNFIQKEINGVMVCFNNSPNFHSLEIQKESSIKGKVILQYRGTNTVLRNNTNSARIDETKIVPREKLIVGSEDFPIFFKLFDQTEVMLCLLSKSIYWKGSANGESFWIHSSESNILENELLVDNENIFIIGRFVYNKPLSLGDVRAEEYWYNAIFKKTDTLNPMIFALR